MRVLTNMASAVLGSILLVGTIGIANADKDSSEDSKKISVTKNSSNDHNDDESDGGVNNPPSTGNNGGGSKGSGGSKGNGGGTSNPPSAGGTTGTTKNPAADQIQTTKSDCSSTGTSGDPVIEGRRAFMRLNCYSCHIANGHSVGMGPSLIGKANEMDAVSSGEDGGMPSFKNNLCKNDIANLSAYIATLGKTSNGKPLEPTFTHWWMPGLPEK